MLLFLLLLLVGARHQTACPATNELLGACLVGFVDTDADGSVSAQEFDTWATGTECGRLGGYGLLTGALLLQHCGSTVGSAIAQGCFNSAHVVEMACQKCRECRAIEARIHPVAPTLGQNVNATQVFIQAYLDSGRR
jgi:hypothetical protein